MRCTPEQYAAIAANNIYHNIGKLPSGHIPYADKNPLYIRPFDLADYRLVSKAAALDALYHLVRAVDNCISMDVNDLTVGDFYYVLLWLRANSSPARPYAFEWNCEQVLFRDRVTNEPLRYDQKWPNTAEELHEKFIGGVCGKENLSLVTPKVVSVAELEAGLELPEGFDFPRVRTMEERDAALKDPEMQFLAAGISWIAGDTWAEKVEKATADPSLVFKGNDLEDAVKHGFIEQVTFRCMQCRVEHTIDAKLTPLNFFQ